MASTQPVKRTHKHTLTLTDTELRLIRAAAGVAGANVNTWIRSIALPAARRALAQGGAR